jgi:hypothetical protein
MAMDDKPDGIQTPTEPKITQEQAITIALAFAMSNGAKVAIFDHIKHISDADYLRELDRQPERGHYMVRFVKDTFADDNRHWKTGEPLPDEAMIVLVNDQTGGAERFYRLL